MTNLEIQDFNFKCTTFLGWEYIGKYTNPNAYTNYGWWVKGVYFDEIDPTNHKSFKGFHSNLAFHSKWSKIMEIIERIQYVEDNQEEFFGEEYYKINFEIDLLNGVNLIIDEERVFMQTAFGKGQLKDAVVGGINCFLDWYEQKLKN